ncbi:hypothetical protein D3C87_1407770 [compost metagenome]
MPGNGFIVFNCRLFRCKGGIYIKDMVIRNVQWIEYCFFGHQAIIAFMIGHYVPLISKKEIYFFPVYFILIGSGQHFVQCFWRIATCKYKIEAILLINGFICYFDDVFGKIFE